VGVTLIGVDPVREPKISESADSITEGEWLGERRRVVIGEALARRLKVGVGSKVVLTVQDLTAELTGQAFRVSGLMNTRSRDLDDGTVLMRITEAQALLGMGNSISEVVITAIDRKEIAAIHARLEATLGAESEVRTWEQLVPLLVYMVDTFDSMGLVLYAAIFIAMSFGIANVLMMAVYERTREIGMMRAMGMGRGRVVAMIIVESCLVTALGLAVGIGLALLGVAALGDGIDISRFADSMDAYGMGTLLTPVVRAQDFAIPILVGSVTAVLAGLWPAYRASRANPANALRHY
jgi:ABC-type lipoprotein release transport system permease subunit